MLKFFLYVLLLVCVQETYSSDWNTVGGTSKRNGYADVSCPATLQIYQNISSLQSSFGYQSFIEGTRVVTTRNDLAAPSSYIVCHDIITGNILWSNNYKSDGKFLAMGLKNGKIIARDFRQNGVDSLFALDLYTGNIIWRSPVTVERGIIWSVVYTENDDIIVFSTDQKRVRININTGLPIWSTLVATPNTGAEAHAVAGNTLYGFEGYPTTPKRLFAMDIATGQVKYYSSVLPGDGDQEIPLFISEDGLIVTARDGGNVYAFRDNGTGFTEVWNVYIPEVGASSHFGIAPDNSIYVPSGNKIIKLNGANGQTIATSEPIASSATIGVRISIDKEGRVYAVNASASDGKFYAFNSSLQTLWTDNLPYNYYSGPAIGMNGLIVVSGSGTIFKIYGSVNNLPVELNSFTAQVQNREVILNWSTATELNNNGFEVQRQYAENEFATIGFVKGEGTKTNQTQYSFADRDLVNGKYSYRLKQIDFNGGYEYSDVIEVEVIGVDAFTLEQNYPNPFNPSTKIKFSVPQSGLVKVQVFDILGNEITTLVNENKAAGIYEVDFNASNLTSGVYLYSIKTDNFNSMKKMILMK